MKAGIGLALAVGAGVSMAAGARHLAAPRAEAGEAVAVVELGVVPGADNLLRAKRLAYRLQEPQTLERAIHEMGLDDEAEWTPEELIGACAGGVEARLDPAVLWVSIHVRSGPLDARDDVANALAGWARDVTANDVERRLAMRRQELEEKVVRCNAMLRMTEVDKRHVVEAAGGSVHEIGRLEDLRGRLGDRLNELVTTGYLVGELTGKNAEFAERLREALAEIDGKLSEHVAFEARLAEFDAEIARLKDDKRAAQREKEQLAGAGLGTEGGLRIVRVATDPSE